MIRAICSAPGAAVAFALNFVSVVSGTMPGASALAAALSLVFMAAYFEEGRP